MTTIWTEDGVNDKLIANFAAEERAAGSKVLV
jgi:hypothetical protein